jgi:hypothetical protein
MIITFYKIYCKDTNITDCYVGHTTNFANRQRRHKSNCKTINNDQYNYKVYTIIRENGGWENWIMEELENTNCDDNEEARIREQELIIQHNAKLNSFDAILNKEKLLKKAKDYRDNHKESISQYKKEYGKENKQLIAQASKDYRDKNKEIISQRRKELYDKNKEIMNQKQREYRAKKKAEKNNQSLPSSSSSIS